MYDFMITLKDYISSSIVQIKEGLGEDAQLSGSIVFELSTTTDKKAGAGINIQIVELGAKVQAQETQKMTIPIKLTSEVDKAQYEASLAEANAKKAMAERMKKDML